MELAVWLLLHGLALLGMAGVWLLPARVWSILRRGAFAGVMSPTKRDLAAALLCTVSVLLAASAGYGAIPRVLECLAQAHCGPNRASGLFALAFFGAAVAQMEVTKWIAQMVFRRQVRA